MKVELGGGRKKEEAGFAVKDYASWNSEFRGHNTNFFLIWVRGRIFTFDNCSLGEEMSASC
jgi:hypothetical protein